MSSDPYQLIFLLRRYIRSAYDDQYLEQIQALDPQLQLTPGKAEPQLRSLEAQVGWNRPLTREELLVRYEQLSSALIDINPYAIYQAVLDLRFDRHIAQKLIDDHAFREVKLTTLQDQIRILSKAKEENPDPFFQHYGQLLFNKHEFMNRMLFGKLNLQDRALLATPGGIYYLEKIFDLPSTGRKETFFRNYNLRYYTRNCWAYGLSFTCCAKAGEYRDVEAIEKYFSEQPESAYATFYGMIQAGYLDLVKIYMPRYLQGPYFRLFDMDSFLGSAVRHGHKDIYDYLVSLYPGDLNHLYKSLLGAAVEGGSVELLAHFLPLVVMDLDMRKFLTESAVESKNMGMIEELERRGILVPEDVAGVAIYVGNTDALIKYAEYLKQGLPEDVEHIFMTIGDTQMAQIIYDQGIRPWSIQAFQDMSIQTEYLDVVKFNLDHYDIGELYSSDDGDDEIDIDTNLKFVLNEAFFSESAEMVTLVLDHPNILKYGQDRVYHIMWRIISDKMPTDRMSTMTLSNFTVTVAQMLADRGFQFPPVGAETVPQLDEFIRNRASN